MTNYYKLEMEHDFGQGDFIFSSPSQAKKWAAEAYLLNPGEDCDFEEYWDDFCYVSMIQLVA